MENTTAWSKQDKNIILKFCDEYISYLDNSKTERLCTKYTETLAIEKGFKNIDDVENLVPGDKVYKINRGKNIVLAVIGKDDILNGTNIVASHIDSPRLDLKHNPLYEDSKGVLFKTHYYGGIK